MAKQKLQAMVDGAKLILSDGDLDAMLALDDDRVYEVRTIPNPNRVGILDQYLGWID